MNNQIQKIEELIRKYNAGECSSKEKTWLEQWYQSFDWTSKGDDQSVGEIEKLKHEVWLVMQSKITERAKVITPDFAQRASSTKWWRYVAAAIFIIAIASAVLYFPRSAKNMGVTDQNIVKKQEATQGIVPGTRKAQLVLGDGRVISLDSARTMSFTEKDGTQIDKISGKLVYSDVAGGNEKIVFNTLSTPRGGEYQLVLPDGSKVWLNAASSIRFPTRFDGIERTVFLDGEAYFEVAKNARMPFYVKLNDGMTAEVLGTHFNIMGYSDENEVRTTLAEGNIKVTKRSESVYVSPSRQAVLNKSDQSLHVSAANVDKALAWKNGMIEFDGDDLPYIMRQLSRWYDVDIDFTGEIPQGKYVGTIRRQAPLSNVLEILKLAGVQFKIENKRVIVTGG